MTPAQRVGPGRDVARRDEHARVADDLGQRGRVRRDDRAAPGHRLERGQPEALVARRERAHRRPAVERVERRLRRPGPSRRIRGTVEPGHREPAGRSREHERELRVGRGGGLATAAASVSRPLRGSMVPTLSTYGGVTPDGGDPRVEHVVGRPAAGPRDRHRARRAPARARSRQRISSPRVNSEIAITTAASR